MSDEMCDEVTPTATAPGSDPVDGLPHPTTRRWQPLRLGLVDLFYYDDEQFWFHDGRLLLRGNNGTGKSKVLALTLPLLLDGSTQPRRVEPDADPKKRMEWNLLLGGAHPSSERTGYSWVEFGRVDPDGTEHFTTLGIGLKAAAGRGLVKTWYFTTTRRVGDLRLLDASRTVLTQERLRVELETTGSGQVHTTRDAYRRAVDEALFRLGEERYAALIDLLIQLRQPQLSKRPDERMLSAALTEALAPLDQAVVSDVAESFRSLEEEREGLADARDTLSAAEVFLEHYRAYTRVAARRHTTAVRVANSKFEHIGRDLRDTEAELDEASARVERTTTQQESAEERQGVLTGRQQALRESPEMRDAERLDREERMAGDLEARVEHDDLEASRARARAEREAADEARAVRRHDESVVETERGEAVAARAAGAAGLAQEHPRITGDAQAAGRSLVRRREQIALVRRLVAAAEAARSRADQQQQQLDGAQASAAGRREDLHSARDEVTEAVVRHGAQVRAYLGGLSHLVVDSGVDQIVELAEVWARTFAGESPGRAAVTAAATTATEGLARRRAVAEQEGARLAGLLEQLQTRILGLESGEEPEPEPAPGRDPAARISAAGAPLWRVTDFADGVSAADRAGLEAALQSAGLVDAWLFPDGTVLAEGDVVLSPADEPGAAGASLSDVLVPAVGPNAVVPEDVVAGVLARIGLGHRAGGALWVDRAGRWGAGPARGSWSKERAEHIGAGAREVSRRELLVRLRADLSRLADEAVVARDVVEEVGRLLAAVAAERDGYPAGSERDVVTAHERERAAGREVERADATVTTLGATLALARERADAATAELTEAATDLGTGLTAAELDQAEAAVTGYADALGELRRSVRATEELAAARAAASTRSAEAAELHRQRDLALRELRTEAVTQRARADALTETVGASVAQLQSRLAEIAAALTAGVAELRRLGRELLEATAQRARLQERERDLTARREESAVARTEVIELLRSFTATGAMRVALPGLEAPDPDVTEEWHVTAALGLARAAEQLLDGSDESDDAWSRVRQRMSSAHTELSTQMSRHGHTAVIDQQADVMVARVRYLSEEIDVDRLAERLAADLADRERLLSAREREILENHLVNEVAGHLHELLLSAQGQIDRMNHELVERKTSTGMQLRVQWRERADGPAGLVAARELMLRSDATWTAADRTAIGGFLQARIVEVREADPAGSWQEHLEQALDYRQWHSFAVERRQNGQWRSASGPASGGERVLAMSVPLFAAASSHYNSAGPLAPRLILLDEAFAGVDDDSRAKSLGLLATFDLDVVMTSEREWGCYPQVPGLAIAQLSRVEGIDAVGVTRWRWDGRERRQVADLDPAARAAASAAADAEPGLYDETLLG